MKRTLRQVGRVIAVLFLLAILFWYAMVQGGFVSWFLFYSVSALLLAGFAMAAAPLRFLRAERSVTRRHLSQGETIKVQISVYKTSRWPCFFVGVRDLVPRDLTLESDPGAFFFMMFSRKKTYSYLVKTEKRGAYTYDSVHVESGDPFGFFKSEKDLPAVNELLVYPRIKPLPFNLQNKRWQRSNTDRVCAAQRVYHEESSNFSGVREYVAGDRLSSIDWKVSARLGNLATKEFDTEEGKGFTVLLDTRAGSGQNFEAAVEWAAATVNTVFDKHSRLNFAALGATPVVSPTGNDRAHMHQVMKELARIEPSLPEASNVRAPLPSTFSFLQTVIYAVPEMNTATLQEIKYLQQRGLDILVLYNEREAFHLPLKQRGVQSYAMPIKEEGGAINHTF
ncbi:DUF58 domain-containing protein [Salicibibacter cibarius]|uniref:DUF58 domain-containing protein n=1 Tax=Salicibibacter cibarius TaxID=2743000 RepID=A0A7T6Z1L7_9BACI|nr:DUF58 domain-containing protein [Salicibibacter cibarius]QQK75286.1 DUF58 domain-containing protein [Salicibibacter cibarius]